jgi:hypothetical protein
LKEAMNMRRLKLSLAFGLLVAAAAAGPVAAQRAVHLTGLPIGVSVVDPFLTGYCGFDVTFTLAGTGSVTLEYNAVGLVIREIDSAPAARITFSGNGSSFGYTSSSQIAVTTYPEGATIGAPARTTLTGYWGNTPNTRPNAGPDVIIGHVADFSAEGIPMVIFDDLVASHSPRPADFAADICAALG